MVTAFAILAMFNLTLNLKCSQVLVDTYSYQGLSHWANKTACKRGESRGEDQHWHGWMGAGNSIFFLYFVFLFLYLLVFCIYILFFYGKYIFLVPFLSLNPQYAPIDLYGRYSFRRAWATLVYPRHHRFLLKFSALPMMYTQKANYDICMANHEYIFLIGTRLEYIKTFESKSSFISTQCPAIHLFHVKQSFLLVTSSFF